MYLNKKIGLIDALSGVKYNIKHLNDNEITISTKENQIIAPNQTLCVWNKGMPLRNDRLNHGNLYV